MKKFSIEFLEDVGIDGKDPIYQQIANNLRGAIEDGRLQPGDRVPGENAIMQRYEVARDTAREALAILSNSGFIRTVPKVGTFVRDDRQLVRKPRRYRRQRSEGPFATDVRGAKMTPDIRCESKVIKTDSAVAEVLKLTQGSPVMESTYLFTADGKPVQSSISHEPYELTQGTEIEFPEQGVHAGKGVISRFDSIGISIDRVDEDVKIRPPTNNESSTLEIPKGIQVFDILRTFFAGGVPVESAEIVIPGDRYSLMYSFSVPSGDEDPQTL